MCSPLDHPTPSLDHFSTEDYSDVYEPAEDSFLFLDALEKDIDILRKLNPSICVEVGCGTGIITAFLASLLHSNNTCFYFGVDLNLSAVKATSRTLKANKVISADVIHDDLLTSLASRLEGQVDVLLFNPPYVPTPSEEVGSSGIEASWAGGKDGREVIDRIIPNVLTLLSDNGVFYLLVLKENNPADICNSVKDLTVETVITRKAGRENLSVLRFIKKSS